MKNFGEQLIFKRAVIVLTGCIGLMWLLVFNFANAQANDAAKFDHMQTGFNLTGIHAHVPCASCHIKGVFKGTPRDCEGCHKPGSRMAATAKPSNHVPTTASCTTCHLATTWTPARFSHLGILPGNCTTCHNGSFAKGKPATHVATTAACDSCHKNTSTWLGATFNHAGVTHGSCATCHNGSTATGKPANHVMTTAACDTCHKSTKTWQGAEFNHTKIAPGTCATCHNGSTATGKTRNHIPTLSWPSCDSCHKSTVSFANTRLHSSVIVTPGSCATCHNGSMATGKTAKHVMTSAV
ncbi:MAG: hypothetical protein WCK93_06775, partial [Nitrosomonadales bacterium]